MKYHEAQPWPYKILTFNRFDISDAGIHDNIS